MHSYDKTYKDFGMGILLKVLLPFLNNKYFGLNFCSNLETFLSPNKKKNPKLTVSAYNLKLNNTRITDIFSYILILSKLYIYVLDASESLK